MEQVLKSFSVQAELITWSPMFLDFRTVFHIFWKNQESCESWLVEFWVSRHSKIKKKLVNFFFWFLSYHYGFTKWFEILILVFLSYLEELQPVKYYLSRISTSRNIKLRKLQNSVLAEFLKNFCPQNLWHFEDVPIKCPKPCLYYIYWVQCLYYIYWVQKGMCKKIKVWTLCIHLVSRPPKYGCFFGKFFVELF